MWKWKLYSFKANLSFQKSKHVCSKVILLTYLRNYDLFCKSCVAADFFSKDIFKSTCSGSHLPCVPSGIEMQVSFSVLLFDSTHIPR